MHAHVDLAVAQLIRERVSVKNVFPAREVVAEDIEAIRAQHEAQMPTQEAITACDKHSDSPLSAQPRNSANYRWVRQVASERVHQSKLGRRSATQGRKSVCDASAPAAFWPRKPRCPQILSNQLKVELQLFLDALECACSYRQWTDLSGCLHASIARTAPTRRCFSGLIAARSPAYRHHLDLRCRAGNSTGTGTPAEAAVDQVRDFRRVAH
eukprot:7383443-Prymnesium_polylepis.2